MATNRIDLLTHNFPRALRGYAAKHVDLFIQELADTLAGLGEEKIALANKVLQLESKLAEHEKREHDLRETLIATQRMLEEIKNSAQREAQLVIEAARSKAENLTAQGNLRLARLMNEIAEAQRIKAQFGFHVRSIIEGHLKLLEMGRAEEDQLLNRASGLLTAPQTGKNAPQQTAVQINALTNTSIDAQISRIEPGANSQPSKK